MADAKRVLKWLKRAEERRWYGDGYDRPCCGFHYRLGQDVTHSPTCELGALIAEYEHEAATTGWQSTVGMFTGDTAMMEISEATRKVREDHWVDGSGGWRPGSELARPPAAAADREGAEAVSNKPTWFQKQLDAASARADKLPDWAKKEAGLPVTEPIDLAVECGRLRKGIDRIARKCEHSHHPGVHVTGAELRALIAEPEMPVAVRAAMEAEAEAKEEGGETET